MRELEVFRHTTNSHTFRDDQLFYSFTDADEESMIKRLESMSQKDSEPSTGTLSASRLVEVARALEKGLKPQDHRFHLRVYKDTLIGSEIVTFIVDSKLASTRGEALQLGRAVCKQFNLLYHVTMDHLLKDSSLYYCFVPPVNRIKGEWFKNTYGNRLRDKMIKAATNREHLATDEYWDLVMDTIENDNFDFRMSTLDDFFRDFLVDSSDKEWTRRVKSFEQSVRRKSAEELRMSTSSTIPEGGAMTRTRQWTWTFIRLDPRQQIHRFYNEVAQTGASHVDHKDRESVRAITIDALRPLFRFLPINLASVFTVWRPTSYDAIRKMMMGDAVGKGLDIKGKSAKRGKLSGFVPFLQINENKHKLQIRRLSPTHMVRVFYKAEARRARDAATAELERVLMDMIGTSYLNVTDSSSLLSVGNRLVILLPTSRFVCFFQTWSRKQRRFWLPKKPIRKCTNMLSNACFWMSRTPLSPRLTITLHHATVLKCPSASSGKHTLADKTARAKLDRFTIVGDLLNLNSKT